MNQSITKKSANTKAVHVKSNDLPVSCPNTDISVWNSHPRVYLELDSNGQAQCQYCGTEYMLDDQL